MSDTITAWESGWVTACDALVVGMTATRLGAGRERKEDDIDPGVGITLHRKIGDRVEAGDPLATVRYSRQDLWESHNDRLAAAWTISPDSVESPDLVIERIE